MGTAELSPTATAVVDAALQSLGGPKGHGHRRPAHGYAWGYNNRGGLGIGSVARALVPVAVTLPADTVDVQGGTDFTVALTSTGQVWTWGGNQHGQLGHASKGPRLTPHRVHLPGHAKAHRISVGAGHVLVLTRDGSVFGWGHNHHGQVGDGTTTDRHTPVRVRAHAVVRLATGVASSHAVTSNGALLSWGRPIKHHGASDATGSQATPRSFALPGGAKVAMVDAGERHLVVLTRRGDLLTFGVDPGGKPLPVKTATGRFSGRVTSISCGDHHTVALTSSGEVLAWGANYYGQLGSHDTTNRDHPVPVRIPGLRGRVVEVASGANSVLVRSSRHQAYVWGHGDLGQNGDGKTDDQTRPHPVRIAPHARVTGVRAGRFHHLVLTDHH